ncbi:uncharacterized protein [Rutidosis leptorrhynchoides]|uniref:uncharacterized protein n=1 Tax=Rutidosis leptorrhynchoides TaxID=125765 RepID=UPI003A98ED04
MTGKKEKSKVRKEQRLQEISLLRTIPYSDHQRWWSSETVAVVTGANRGIGFEIARQLAGHGLTVILTARDTAVGEEAAKVLQETGLTVDFQKLDIIDPESIKEFCEWVQTKYGGVDILVNNAGVNFNLGNDNSVENAHMVIETNYYGTKNITKAMIPLMRNSSAGARIVSVSSRLGRLNGKRNKIRDETMRQQLSDVETLTEEVVDGMVTEFLKQVDEGTWESGGWPKTLTDYSISKLAVNAYTRITAKELSERPDGEKIYVNCYCPGWVKTAMTGYSGSISTENGADTGVWLALLPELAISGKFFAERREINF